MTTEPICARRGVTHAAAGHAGAPGAHTHCVHYVLVSLGTAGDIFPFLAVARALQSRGHRVSFLAAEVFADHVRAAGIEFHSLIERATSIGIMADPRLWHPLKGFATAWRAAEDALWRVPQFVAGLPQDTPCTILAHPLAMPAAALARALRPDLRIVAAYLAPSNMKTCHDPMMLGQTFVPGWVPMAVRRWLWRASEALLVDPAALPSLNRARAHYGQAPVEHFIAHMQDSADCSIGLFPAWYGPAQPDWPQPFLHADFRLYDHQPGAGLSEELSAFLAAGGAPVVFTPGTGYTHARQYFVHALAAVRQLGCRAIFLTPFRQQVPDELPPEVLWQDFLPLRALLPHAAALVHHGGIGTMAEAMRAGVPQLLVPCAHDQFDNARRVRALGVGEVLTMRRLRTATLRRALYSLMTSDSVAAACRVLATRLAREPDAGEVCAMLEAASAAPACDAGRNARGGRAEASALDASLAAAPN